MTGRTVAVYSLKGGVGKTTLAVNLAWAAAALSARRTLLWDLDAQAASSWILGDDNAGARAAQGAITRDGDPRRLIRPTVVAGLDLLPADASLRQLDVAFHELGRRKRVARIAQTLATDYDRIVIDAPPGLTDTSDQIMRAADLVVVPVIPSALSRRALDAIATHIQRKGPRVTLAPVFSMVDRRRAVHREALSEHPDWPVIPMASPFEAMTSRRAPLGTFAAPTSPAVVAVTMLWQRVERALVEVQA